MSIIQPKGYFTGAEVTDRQREHLEPVELVRLFEALQGTPFWYGYFRLGYYFGCRVSEPALVLKENISFQAKRIVLRRLKKRSGHGFVECEYGLPDVLVPVLKAVQPLVPRANPWFFGSPRRSSRPPKDRLALLRRQDSGWTAVSRSTADIHFRDAATRAGLPASLRHSHVLRHTRATLLLADGASVEDVQYLLGHANLNTTRMYLGFARAFKQRADTVAALGLGDLA